MRVGFRVAAMTAWSVLGLGMLLAGLLLTLPWAEARGGWRRVIMRAWGRGLARVLGVRIVVARAAPAPPFFLVSNHLSYLDIVVYAAVAPGRFVAKREVRGWPGVGLLAALAGTIFIDRTAPRDVLRVQGRLARAVEAGEGVLVFAEATSSPGREVLPFRPALLDWAARTGRPVHFASISYTTPPGAPPAHESVCWWGDMEFAPHVAALCRLPGIRASVQFGSAPIAGTDRRVLAERLRGAVADEFQPVVGD